MDCPTILNILLEMSSYASQGDSYLRNGSISAVKVFFCSLRKHGIDGMAGVQMILPEVRLLEKLVKDHRRIWITLCARSGLIYLSSIFFRGVLVSTSNAENNSGFAAADVGFISLSLVCSLVLSIWLSYRYAIFGWNKSRQRDFWIFLQDYLALGRFSLQCPEIGLSLRMILHNEWRSGVDGTACRENFLRGRIVRLRTAIEKELEFLGVILIGTEFMAYILGYFGYCFLPLVRTLESVSGI